MEIPKPRLKGLVELDLEAKTAERAVVAIRKKSMQIDSELEKIRDDVEGELERLDTQRSYLESAMQEIMQEQAFVMKALSELESRQTSHKHNVQMLKEEEEQIESERREINMALRELRGAQKTLKETVSKKYFQGPASAHFKPMQKPAGFDWKESIPMKEDLSLNPEKEWQAEQEAEVKPVHMPTRNHSQEQPQRRAIQEQKHMPAPIAAEIQSIVSEPSQDSSPQIAKAESPSKKPGILRRLRLSADKFLPQPFRINKPAIAILEEQIDQADSAQAIETNVERAVEASPELAPMAMQSESNPQIAQEIESFEQKLSQYDSVNEPEAMQASKPPDDIRSRLSSIIRGKKPIDAKSSSMPQKPQAEKMQLKTPIESKPSISTDDSDVLAPAPKLEKIDPHAMKVQKKKAGMNDDVESSIPSGDKSFVVIEHPLDPKKMEKPQEAEPTFEDAKKEIIRTLSTEAKLARLHSKLQEMKSALKSISEDRHDRPAEKKVEKKAKKRNTAKAEKKDVVQASNRAHEEFSTNKKSQPQKSSPSIHNKIEQIKEKGAHPMHEVLAATPNPLFEKKEAPLHLAKGKNLFEEEKEIETDATTISKTKSSTKASKSPQRKMVRIEPKRSKMKKKR